MKNILLPVTLVLLITGFYSCTKTTDDNNKALCENNIKDGEETEIDCGGDCSPCPPASTFSCVINGVGGEYRFTSMNGKGQQLNPSIRVYGTNASLRPLNFMFIPNQLNVPLVVLSSSFDYAGEPYIKADGDTGSVTITKIDTVRRIISGTFAFSAQRVTKSFIKCQVNEGVFANVRYFPLR